MAEGEVMLSLKPQQVASDVWYYEENGGIEIYYKDHQIALISWRKLEASLKRKKALR